MMGPQWLCDCNASGGAVSLDGAASGAGRHLLGHPGPDGAFSVAVYRERGDWAYNISTKEQAQKAATPPIPTLPPSLRPSLTALSATFESFNEEMTFPMAQRSMMQLWEQSMGISQGIEWNRSRKAA